jgi:hypothetical protein
MPQLASTTAFSRATWVLPWWCMNEGQPQALWELPATVRMTLMPLTPCAVAMPSAVRTLAGCTLYCSHQ